MLQRNAAGKHENLELESALQEETQRLAAQDLILDPLRSELERVAGPHLRAFREALFDAVSRLAAGDFAGAFTKIRASEGAMEELHRFVESIRGLKEVEEAWHKFLGELALDSLADLPTLAIPNRLLNLSRNYLKKARPRESRVVSQLCRRILDRLAHRSERLPKLTGRVESLCREIKEATPREADCALTVTALETNGYNDLASGLTDDLEVALLGWRSQSRRTRSPVAGLVLQLAEVSSTAESIKQTFLAYIPDSHDQS